MGSSFGIEPPTKGEIAVLMVFGVVGIILLVLIIVGIAQELSTIQFR